MSEKSLKLLQKNTCVHKENKCNHLNPFSMIELQKKEKFTKDEKNLNLKKYKMACKNQAGNYTNPTLRRRIFNEVKRGSKGGRAGQWTARKAQIVARRYKAAGGGYRD